ncbi:hypothetical protein BH11PSE7_BH11PSE7_18820 [soil metagenome]
MKNLSCIAALMASVALLAGCGGGDSTPVGFTAPPPGAPAVAPAPAPAPVAPPTVQLAAASAVPGLTFFYQVGPNDDPRGGYSVPGASPNVWDLNADMSMEDGGHDQLDGALSLSIKSMSGVIANSGSFPSDQTYSELKYLTPEYTGATGTAGALFNSAKVKEAPLANTTTIAWLTPSQDSRMQQTVTVPSVGAGTLTWDTISNTASANGSDGSGSIFTGDSYFFRVVLRNSAGAVVGTLYDEQSGSVVSGTLGVADMTPYAGQTLALSFEARSYYHGEEYGYYGPGIDNVSLLHGATQVITNGTFEAGGTGWATNQPVASQNVASGTRTVADLTTQRSVYVPPAEKWGRWTDSFTNPTATTITATVTFHTNLGSDGSGIIYSTPGTAGRAVTTWDGSMSDRDVAIVYGNNAAPQAFSTDDGLGNHHGNDNLDWDYTITVAPGATVTIVQFIVLPSNATGQTPGVTISTKATVADAVALDIMTNFRNDVKYRHGMTQQQIDTLFNF